MSNLTLNKYFGIMGGCWNFSPSGLEIGGSYSFHKESCNKGSCNDDLFWMRQALSVGLGGVGIASPNPSVGCVLLDCKGLEVDLPRKNGHAPYAI